MFTAVTTSFVSDIMLPPLSVIFPLNKNLQEKFAVLRPGPNYAREDGYNTLKLAQDDGAVVMAYGWVQSGPALHAWRNNGRSRFFTRQSLHQPNDQFLRRRTLPVCAGRALPASLP